MVEILALVLQHDEQAVLCAVEMALDAGIATKTYILNLLHRLIDGKPGTVAPIDAPACCAPGPRPSGRRSSVARSPGPAGPCAVSTGAGRVPHRPGARRSTEPAGRARCTPGAARGSVVSPCCLLQDELVQGEVRDRLPELGILQLQFLQPLHLIQFQPAVFLAPPVVSHLGHADLQDRPLLSQPLAKQGHRPIAAWRLSLQACASSLACSDPP